MSKFCKYCGKELSENEACNCSAALNQTQKKTEPPANVAANQSDNIYESSGQQSSSPFDGLISFLKTYFKNPSEAVSAMVRSQNIISSVVLNSVFVLSIMLCYLGICINVNKVVVFSVWKGLLYGLLLAVILVSLSNIGSYIYGSLCKKNVNYVKTYIGITHHLVFPSMVFLLSFLIALFSIKLFFITFIIGLTIYVASMLDVSLSVAGYPNSMRDRIVFNSIAVVKVLLVLLVVYLTSKDLLLSGIMNTVGSIGSLF